MTRCLDEVKLQCYWDGELPLEMMESVTSHLASCATCAAAARELEEESALLTAAFAAEFEANVPTERLRQRIDEAVLGERLATARSEKTSGLAGFFASLLNFGTQRTLGYASLAVVLAFAAIFAVVKMRNTHDIPEPIASTTPEQQPAKTEIAKAPSITEPVTPAPITVSAPVKTESTASYRPAKFTANSAPKPAPVKLLPGERAYLQTIARLDSTIKSNKKGMRPALQVEYERNLAVVDRAIAATRSAAKSNPNDPDAADFMFEAYQSKVDFLNTIADARVGGPRH